jgi:hypothetical protein
MTVFLARQRQYELAWNIQDFSKSQESSQFRNSIKKQIVENWSKLQQKEAKANRSKKKQITRKLLLIVARFLHLRMLGVVFFQKRTLPRTWSYQYSQAFETFVTAKHLQIEANWSKKKQSCFTTICFYLLLFASNCLLLLPSSRRRR